MALDVTTSRTCPRSRHHWLSWRRPSPPWYDPSRMDLRSFCHSNISVSTTNVTILIHHLLARTRGERLQVRQALLLP